MTRSAARAVDCPPAGWMVFALPWATFGAFDGRSFRNGSTAAVAVRVGRGRAATWREPAEVRAGADLSERLTRPGEAFEATDGDVRRARPGAAASETASRVALVQPLASNVPAPRHSRPVLAI